MRLTNTILPPFGQSPESSSPESSEEEELRESPPQSSNNGDRDPAHTLNQIEPEPALLEESIQQIEREQEVQEEVQKEQVHNDAIQHGPARVVKTVRRLTGFRKFIEQSKAKKTPRLLLQIWQSDFSIVAFVLVMVTFYLMKDIRYPPVGVLFFLLAMATVDAILSIFVVRLSFHQNKHGFYRTEDFQRDWLRYRILLSMTKAALLFVVGSSCGSAAVIASYIVWFFTSTQRLRYLILRWSMDDHYPELQRWSIFMLLREAGIEPKLKNFNLVAVIGVIIGFAIVFIF
jgi:hypothetical protein